MKESGSDFTEIIHHSDRGTQFISVVGTAVIKELGVQLSVGSTGDPYDNTLAAPMDGVYKAERVQDRLFDSAVRLELETADWVCWGEPESVASRSWISDFAGDVF